MTLTMQLDDTTRLDTTDVRAALTSQQRDDYVIVYLTHDNGAELIVGFRSDLGVCLWHYGDDVAVTTGGRNGKVTVYGWSSIPFPPGSEIDAAAVIDAAEEFAATARCPTQLAWTDYYAAMPVNETQVTPESLDVMFASHDHGGSSDTRR